MGRAKYPLRIDISTGIVHAFCEIVYKKMGVLIGWNI
jgi:hypothetical protein